MKAPQFTLPDQNGEMHSLTDYKGKWVALYFYPKDDTPGCTKEACNFRDQREEYTKRSIEIIGVSKDTVVSHDKFSKKYNLNFTILADPDHKAIEQYHAWGVKKFMGKEFSGTHRNTVLINPAGEIVKEYQGVNPLTHSAEILKDFDQLASTN